MNPNTTAKDLAALGLAGLIALCVLLVCAMLWPVVGHGLQLLILPLATCLGIPLVAAALVRDEPAPEPAPPDPAEAWAWSIVYGEE